MTIETKYDAGNPVFLSIGSDEGAKIVSSIIQSIDCVIMAISGIKITYNCIINRKEIGTYVDGMPENYTVKRTEDKIFSTLEECVENMTPKRR